MRRVSGGASTADRVRRQTKGTSAAGSGGRVGCSSGRSARPGWLPVAVEFFFLAEEVPLPKKTILAETARPPRLETVCNLIYEIPLPPTAKSLAPLVLEAANQEEPARLSECRYPARYRTWVVWPTPGGVPGTGTSPALLYDLARFVNQIARDFTPVSVHTSLYSRWYVISAFCPRARRAPGALQSKLVAILLAAVNHTFGLF